MSTITPTDEESIFAAALGYQSSGERSAFLQVACGGDEQLIQRIEALLCSHEQAGPFLNEPAVARDTVDLPPREEPGSQIGCYKLVEPIGEGGFGIVYLAEQQSPVRRRVALKVIKPGMDTREVIARFEAERQALALMEHPNIAKVLDAGTTAGGRPYFVMELVQGVPITEYCDQCGLTTRERLELFVTVCQAVQHAHQKGVIHRDIKPTNVMLTIQEGRPAPKIIDFGVAKALNQRLTEQTLATGFAQMIGTPLYMSPEQSELSPLGADTRSDVYSLGVLLYELLTGTTPFDKARLHAAGYDELRRILREEEPPRPSVRLSTLAAELATTIVVERRTNTHRLVQQVRGELDWIVMRCLEKDRNRRYETANELAVDVQRYLDDEPVLACPPSAIYRVRKFVRKHWGPVIASAALATTLGLGVIGTTLGMLQAGQAAEQERQAKIREVLRADGERRAKLQAVEKQKEAERNLAFARKGNEILGSVFAGLAPETIAESGRPLQDLLRENLTEAVKELEGSAIGHPMEVAAMQNTLGMSLYALGEAELALEVHIKALNTRKAMLGPEDPDTLISMDNVAKCYQATGDFDHALPLLEETLKLTRARFGHDSPETLTSMNNLAVGYGAAGKIDEALPLLEETFKLTKARFGHDHPETLTSMFNLATGYGTATRTDLALPLLEETLKLTKAQLGTDHPMTLSCMNSLGTCYWELRQLDKSIPLLEELLPLREKTLGRSHPKTLRTVAGLGVNYHDAGRLAEAIPLLEEAFEASHEHTALRWVGTWLLDVYATAGKPAEAASLVDKLLGDARQTWPKDSPQLAGQLAAFGLVLLEMEAYVAAEPLLRECLAIREEHEPDAWTTFNTQSMLGGSLLGQNKYKDAQSLLLEGYEGMKVREKAIPLEGDTRIPETLDRLIELYTSTDKPEEAKKWRAERAKYPPHK